MTRISVVLITHNRREQLRRTLRHMTSLPDDAPILVADNASTDGSADLVAREFPRVRLLRLVKNLGAVARNLAVAEVTTPYVAFCDDDTCWQPGALTRAADLLDAHPGLASVTGRCLVEPGLGEDPITPELRESPVPGPDWLPGPALLGIMAGLTAVRVDAFRAVGGFSSRMWLGGEEELFALDLAARGWWMCWAEDVVIHHSPSARRDPRERRRLGIRNTLWTLVLRRPWSAVFRRGADVLRSAPFDAATLAALAEVVRGLPGVLAERRVVPPRVEEGLRLLEGPQRDSAARRYVG
ncbi:glycosyltransferase family 2 protein [Amycolatopsis sp. FDAARGOS 1241]|uniref:glycosyltransferase family 2 protein n=1 Tax=Amycolatopsis sp. FDAARGOS 1241 TaxID=2778070 RepID=UPI001951041F|nr:glycosyltransferase [Amycolatopsis sp. FDAARGOS 1241]QRP49725.1 glycosyltransferase [Amycolatopsis sp. FDAARGOS 1241]